MVDDGLVPFATGVSTGVVVPAAVAHGRNVPLLKLTVQRVFASYPVPDEADALATNSMFDNYSPSLAYGNYHGSVDLLSEAASAALATSVTVEEEEFKTYDGFDPRKRAWNHPLPWKGGEWTLADIVEYDAMQLHVQRWPLAGPRGVPSP